MLERYSRTLVPRGLRAAAMSAGLVSAMALAVPSLATAVEISAITPALVFPTPPDHASRHPARVLGPTPRARAPPAHDRGGQQV